MRRDALEQSSVVDEVAFRNNLKVGREIADFLRKNIVQAERSNGDETYSTFHLLFLSSVTRTFYSEIRFTEHTELGDNTTIKNPENMVEMPRRQRKERGKISMG
jgi:peptide chain release factor